MKRFLLFSILLFFTITAVVTHAQEGEDGVQLQITAVDISNFPTVRVSAFINDNTHAPIADLSRLSLRENSIPLPYELVNVPVGIDVVFVIDANADYGENSVDANGRTRRQKVRDSIIRYAEQFMNPDGLDRVSVIVPDGESGRFLVQNSTDPAELIAAMKGYYPDGQAHVPLNKMLSEAITQTVTLAGESRYQALLLFTDARQMGVALDYDALTTQAAAHHLPLNVSILGEAVDDTEQANADGLAEPTGAIVTPLPTGGEMEALYGIWEAQGNRPQVVYESVQRKNGRYRINLNLGTANDAMEYDLALQPATITVESAGSVHRVGAAYNTLLPYLQPPTTTVTIAISWGDGISRTVAAATLYADDSPIATFTDLPPAEKIPVVLDIAYWDDRTVEFRATMIDAVDMEAESETAVLHITTERPILKLPTPAPTVAPIIEEPPLPLRWRDSTAWGLMAVAVVLLLLLYHFRRQRQGEDVIVEKTAVRKPITPPPPIPPAFLIGEGKTFPLNKANITIGSDEARAILLLEDRSVASLHARIRRRDGRYYLYDEGSPIGTFHNYEKVGMTPHLLEEGDTIQVGKLIFTFQPRGNEAAKVRLHA